MARLARNESGEQYLTLFTESLRRITGQVDALIERTEGLEKAVVEISTKMKLLGLSVLVGVPLIVAFIQGMLWLATKTVHIGGQPTP